MIATRTVMGRIEYYENNTSETVLPIAPIVFSDDFLFSGYVGVSADQLVTAVTTSAEDAVESLSDYSKLPGSNCWNIYNSGGVSVEHVESTNTGAKGVVAVGVTADDATQQVGMYFGDALLFNLSRQFVFEARAALPIVPTGADGEMTSAVLGVCSAIVAGAETSFASNQDHSDVSAWFRWDGSGVVRYEVDDGTTDTSQIATGITMSAGRYYQFRIECSGNTIRFYIDGVLVGTQSIAFTNDQVQPIAQVWKTKATRNTSVGTMHIDKVAIWQDR